MTSTTDALPELRVRVKTIDAGLLGRRLRHARQRAGMTQGDAAGTDMSTAYISRIEAGQRRPGAELLIALAERLQCTTEELLAPDDTVVTFDAAVVARLTLELDYAELELRTGSASAALGRADAVLDEASRTSAVTPELRSKARLIHALALESTGDGDAAIDELEILVAADDDPRRRIQAFTALSRCYRDRGDLAHAGDIAERAASGIGGDLLHASADGLKLTVTVAAAHYERGDVTLAVRMCQQALAAAEELDSPEARAAAYWNTSIMESRQGRVDAAVELAEKALSLLEAAEDARSQTRLRIQLGLLHLRSEAPLVDEALIVLERASVESRHADLNTSDRSHLAVGLARAHFLRGDLGQAQSILGELLRSSDHAPAGLVGIEAIVLAGQISSVEDDTEGAVERFRQASELLEAVGNNDHGVAQLWFELGTLFDELGLFRESAGAFKKAGASTGLTRTMATI